jgi:lipoyl-dependent peroxiredoxin
MSHHIDRINPLLTATANTRDRRPQRPHRIERQSREGRPVGDQGNGRPRHTGHRHPEHLFAAGYAACFGASLDFAAKQQNKDATNATVSAAVSIGPREGGGLGIAVRRSRRKTIHAASSGPHHFGPLGAP